MRGWLTDTGPFVAILDRDDPNHTRWNDALRRARSPLVTTWPVFTEASYLLAFSRQAQDGLLDMIQRGVVFIAPITDQDVPRVRVLMEKVQGCPHGFRRRYSRPHRGARIDLGHVHTR